MFPLILQSLISILILLSFGYAGHMTLTRKNNVQTSHTIFMESIKDPNVYVEVRNSSCNSRPSRSLAGDFTKFWFGFIIGIGFAHFQKFLDTKDWLYEKIRPSNSPKQYNEEAYKN